MALKAKDLIVFLQKDPEAMVRFYENKFYSGHECSVGLYDFEYDKKRQVFVLPNLCQCFPEPD